MINTNCIRRRNPPSLSALSALVYVWEYWEYARLLAWVMPPGSPSFTASRHLVFTAWLTAAPPLTGGVSGAWQVPAFTRSQKDVAFGPWIQSLMGDAALADRYAHLDQGKGSGRQTRKNCSWLVGIKRGIVTLRNSDIANVTRQRIGYCSSYGGAYLSTQIRVSWSGGHEIGGRS